MKKPNRVSEVGSCHLVSRLLAFVLFAGISGSAWAQSAVSGTEASVAAPATASELPASSIDVTPSSGLWWEGTFPPLDAVKDQGPAVSSQEAARPMPGTTGEQILSYDAMFERDLFVQTDLVLPGIESVQTITFPRPHMWQLLTGSEVRLVIEHSPVLLPKRSHITIYINNKNIISVRLDETNANETVIRFPLPVDNLQDYNQLKMVVQQHYTDECEDPFDPALWTMVSRRSSLHFNYRYKPINAERLHYPLPIFDRLGYGPTVLRYVLPQKPSAQTLQALGMVTAGLGREVSYGHVAIGEALSTYNNASGHVLLIGTPQENPEVTRLVGDRLTGLGPGAGVISLQANPTNPFAAVLVISGNDPAGVLLAARALTTSPREELLSGTTSVITQAADGKPSILRERPEFVPNETSFTLKQFGFQDTTVRGFFSQPLRVDVRSLPDLQFIERMQTLRIYYSYGAQLDNRLSTLEVQWNNITLKSVPLDDPLGKERAVIEINLPVEVIAPYNNLQFVFNLYPRSYDPCTLKEDEQLWGTLFADSSFFMPRYHYARMPDLGKLQYGRYPFGLYQDLSETMLVLPDNPDNNDMLAGLALAAELGRATVADRVALKFVRASEVTEEMKRDNHMILVGSGNTNTVLEAVKAKRALWLAGNQKQLADDGAAVLQAQDANAHGTLEQLVSPYGTEKTVTVVYGVSPEYLKRAVRMMSDVRVMSRLSGNVAVMGLDNEVRKVNIGPSVHFGSIPFRLVAERWGRDHMWVMVALLLIALFLLFLILKFLLSRYRRQNHGGGGGGGGGERRPPPPVTEMHPDVPAATSVAATSPGGAGPDYPGSVSPAEAPMSAADGWFEESVSGPPQRRLPPRRQPASRRPGDPPAGPGRQGRGPGEDDHGEGR